MTAAEPFDREARRRARDRARPGIARHDPLLRHVAEELDARAALLGPVPEGPVLRIGLLLPPPPGTVALDPGFAVARAAGGVQADEDRLPIADGSVARIEALMTLHGVNDLPGALILMRRALKPGGRLIAAFPAGLTLGPLRAAFLEADLAAGGGIAPRLGPTVDPAEGAGLLQRAGFAEPVAAVEPLVVRTRSLATLARDVAGMGDSGWLAARGRGLTTPRRWAAAEVFFARAAEADGKVPVPVDILYLSGKAPVASAAIQGRT
jgi:SAM-dependent methyltransferase